MNKFKVGDVVQYYGNGHYGTVLAIDDQYVWVKWEDSKYPGGYGESALRKVDIPSDMNS